MCVCVCGCGFLTCTCAMFAARSFSKTLKSNCSDVMEIIFAYSSDFFLFDYVF